MSKGSLFWANASGKLGETVLYRAGGEQRTRSYVARIKNPKTLLQMQNRILMNNVVSMFRSIKPVILSAFPNRPSNQSAFNAFVKANKNTVQYGITKDDLAQSVCIPFGLTIAVGNLSIPTQAVQGEVADPTDGDAPARYGMIWSQILQQDVDLAALELGIADVDIWAFSAYALYKVLTANGNPYNLPSTFKVTIVGADYSDEFDGNAVGYKLGWCQYICSSDRSKCQIIRGGYNDSAQKLGITMASVSGFQNPTTDEGSVASGTLSELSLTKGQTSDSDVTNMCVGVIISYTGESKQEVTTSKMNGGNSVPELVSDWQKGGFVYEQVLENYGYSQEALLATR